MPIEQNMDISNLMFLMDDGRLGTPREFSRSITCPEMNISPRRSHNTRTHVNTSRSYPNTASTAIAKTPYHQSVPCGQTSKRSFHWAPRTPKTAIAYYSPINKPDTPFSFSASFSRSSTSADFHTFSRQSTRIWTHSRPSTRATTSSNMDDALAGTLAVPVPTISGTNNSKIPRKKTKRRTKSNSDPGGLKQASKMTSRERKGSIGSMKSEKSEKSHTGTIFLEAAQKGMKDLNHIALISQRWGYFTSSLISREPHLATVESLFTKFKSLALIVQ